MSDLTFIALAAAAALAVNNWLAVAQRKQVLEYIAKPGTMVALVVVAVTLQPESNARRWAVVAGLVFSLLGDIFLMLPRDRFLAGVGAFFCAHVAYIVAFRIGKVSAVALLIGAALVALFAVTVGRPILIAVRDTDQKLVTPVSAYIAVISVMVASAIATRSVLATVGAIVFMTSDTLIAWNRFVQPLAWAPVTVMVTYHAGQTAIVLSLLRS